MSRLSRLPRLPHPARLLRQALLLGSCALLLGGCGFYLRGAQQMEFAISEIALEARNAYGQTVAELGEALQQRKLKLRAGAVPTLVLLEEQQDTRALGRGGSVQTVEMETTLSLDYQLLGKKRLPLAADSLQVRRIYVQDDNNIAATSGEQEQLQAEMRRELVEQLLLRLQALTPQRLQQMQQQADQRQAQREAERLLRSGETPAPAQQPE